MLPLHATGVIRNWCFVAHQRSQHRPRPPVMPARPLRTAQADVTGCAGQSRVAPLACTLASVRRMDSPGPCAGYQQFTCRLGEGALRLQWTDGEPASRADLGAIFAADCKDNPRRLAAAWFIARDGQVRCDLLVLEYLDCDERVYGVPRALPFLTVKSAGTAQQSARVAARRYA